MKTRTPSEAGTAHKALCIAIQVTNQNATGSTIIQPQSVDRLKESSKGVSIVIVS